MNAFQKSMEGIQASKELKESTLRYLETQRMKKSRGGRTHGMRYVLAAVCLFLLFTAGGYSVYIRPVSYISIDINPSIEMGINRFGRVVSAKAYNADGQMLLRQVSLKNVSYVQAIDLLLEGERSNGFLRDDSLLVFTVISDQADVILSDLDADEALRNYELLTYTSDTACMEEAHRYEMSFGKYRAYLELAQYDEDVTVEECDKMSMREIHNRIESCGKHGESGTQGGRQERHHGERSGHHGGGE